VLTVLFCLAGTSVANAAETLSVSAGPDPTQNKPLTITAQGTADGAHALYMYVDTSTSGCSTNPSGESSRYTATSLSNYGGDPIAAGSYTKAYSYTPAYAATYTLCGYLDTASSDPPDVSATAAFTSRMPTASVVISHGADPTQNKPVSISVTGSTEVSRNLYVYMDTSTSGCSTNPSGESSRYTATSLSNYGGDPIAAGSYTKAYSYTPAYAATYTLCGYVDDASANTPDAAGTDNFAIAGPVSPPASGSGTSTDALPSTSEVSPQGARSCVGSPTPPVLLGPPDGTSGSGLRPVFQWGPSAISPTLVILDNEDSRLTSVNQGGYVDWAADGAPSFPSVSDVLSRLSVAPDHSGTAKLAQKLPPGTYGWRVTDQSCVFSPIRHFRVLGPVLHKLRVRTRSAPGRSTRYPGRTYLKVRVTPYAAVSLTLNRSGHTLKRSYYWGSDDGGEIVVRWSCLRPGGSYRFTLTAQDDQGHKKTLGGRFRPVSRSQCRRMRSREIAAAHARARAEREAERRRQQQAAAEEAASYRRFVHNCHVLYGHIATYQYPDSTQTVCVSWYGTVLGTL
jgi:hypothetical protein